MEAAETYKDQFLAERFPLIGRLVIGWRPFDFAAHAKEIPMNIYVGNLSYNVTEEDLKEAFSEFGKVESVNIIKDRSSGRSKGFGFVDMPDSPKAVEAIKVLDGRSLRGRDLKVNQANEKPRERKPSRPRY